MDEPHRVEAVEEVRLPANFLRLWEEHMDGHEPPQSHEVLLYGVSLPFSTLLGYQPVSAKGQVPDKRWHLSIATQERVPTWGEMVAIAHRLRPGVWFQVAIPPKQFWMNVHPFTLHLWEMKDGNLIEQMRDEARGHQHTRGGS